MRRSTYLICTCIKAITIYIIYAHRLPYVSRRDISNSSLSALSYMFNTYKTRRFSHLHFDAKPIHTRDQFKKNSIKRNKQRTDCFNIVLNWLKCKCFHLSRERYLTIVNKLCAMLFSCKSILLFALFMFLAFVYFIRLLLI